MRTETAGMTSESTVKDGKHKGEPDLSSRSGHVVVTGAAGRYLNPLRERETDVTDTLAMNATSLSHTDLLSCTSLWLWRY